MNREPVTLWEGACAYGVEKPEGYDICVFSSNHVQHLVVATGRVRATAERLVGRLNAYPANTRRAYGLL